MADIHTPAYFQALGDDRYEPTAHASGAWREDELHLAPVAGLLIHHMDRWRELHTDGTLTFSRISIDVLGQIGRETIELRTEVIRPGRTIEMIETIATIAGRVTLRARAWLLQRNDTEAVEGTAFPAMPTIDSCSGDAWLKGWGGGFISSIDARQALDSAPGNARAWVSSELSLVEGEAVSPLADFCKLLDTANGLAIRADPTQWMYPNVDLTLHLFRQPIGTTVGFDTRVAFGPEGVGVTSSVVHDVNGPVATLQQSLTVRRMPEGGM
ncbi:MAG: thioesterase family protein [Microbacteriaceae bacterium]|nr:thioesterase family protein [Microbacteriaceae bacterium]